MRITSIPALFLMLTGLTWSAAPPAPPTLEARTRMLLERLASAEVKAREDATQQLLKLEGQEPTLRKALQATKDAELRRRLRRILDDFAQRQLQRTLAAIKDDGKHGRTDLLAERRVH
jgi:hypothetical protein